MIYNDQVIPVGNNTMQANLATKIYVFFDLSIHRLGRREKHRTEKQPYLFVIVIT